MNKTILALLIMCAIAVCIGFFLFREQQLTIDESASPSVPLNVHLVVETVSEFLSFEKRLRMSVTTEAVVELSNVRVTVDLASGLKVVEGPLSWQGDLEPNDPVSFNLEVKATKRDQWILVEANAAYDASEQYGIYYVDTEKLWVLYTSYNQFMLSKEPPSEGDGDAEPI